MMSGTSIVLLLTPTGEAYFYRGAFEILPISPTAPKFAESVDLGATLGLYASISAPLPSGMVVSNSSKSILLGDGRIIEPNAVNTLVELVVVGGAAWESVLAQLTVCITTAEADSCRSILRSKILALQEEKTREAVARRDTLVDALKLAFANAPANVDLTIYTHEARERVIAQKKIIHDAQSIYRVALGRVEQICSFRIVSARAVGVQQAQRRAAVEANVSRASNLTAAELADKLMQNAEGFAVARVDPDAVLLMLNQISSSKMEDYLERIASPMRVVTPSQSELDLCGCMERRSPGFLIAPNCIQLDVESVQIMLEHHQPEHVLSSDGKQLTFCMQGVPHVVLPIYKNAYRLDGVTYLDFMNLANEEAEADYRVTLRNMLAKLKLRLSINPASVHLTLGIQIIPLSLMCSIATTVTIEHLTTDSAVCETLRGLMYLWATFAASGKSPCTFAFQLLQPGAKLAMPKKRWCVLSLARLAPPLLTRASLPSAANGRSMQWSPTCIRISRFPPTLSSRICARFS
jgi:hypothetical protein